MKLTVQQKKELEETQIGIQYPEMTRGLTQIVRYIRQYEHSLEGIDKDRTYQIPIAQIYYIETTDRKTFLYLKDQVYECRTSVQALEAELEETTMVRIGKATLMNTAMLESVSPYPNHRLSAQLENGEKLIVSRKYIAPLKEKIRRECHA